VDGAILLVRDLTAVAAAERAKQDFVSMVGHELRTPLTLIRTSVDLLCEEAAGPLNATQRPIADVLRSNADRLQQLISDLLDMSAIDSGRVQVHPVLMDLGELVRETVAAHAGEAEGQRIALAEELPAGGVEVWADRGRVRQVLQNLVHNALKYTPAGGHVTVRVSAAPAAARIDVTDDGIGVPPAEQPRLFEKFYRTRAGQRHSGGTGLGLAIARSLVELHGGEIWCESDGTSGSTFSFTLPREPAAGDRAGR
jgi:signal transduction histidine kinase